MWQDEAECRGLTPLFYSDIPADLERAKAVCAICPVSNECREAGKTEAFGVWGGQSASDRGARRGVVGPKRRHSWKHGTVNGYEAHMRAGESACDDCVQASREYRRSLALMRNKQYKNARITDIPPVVLRDLLYLISGAVGNQVPCGSERGYRGHLRRGEPICDDCRLAHRVYRRGDKVQAGAA